MKVRAVLLGITLLTVLVVGTGFAQQTTGPAKGVSVQNNDPGHVTAQNPALRTNWQPATKPEISASVQNNDPEHVLDQNPALRTAWQPEKSPFNSTHHGHH